MLSPTEERILNKLRDHRPHSVDDLSMELYKEITDYHSKANNIRVHIFHIRKKIKSDYVIYGFYKSDVYYYQLIPTPQFVN